MTPPPPHRWEHASPTFCHQTDLSLLIQMHLLPNSNTVLISSQPDRLIFYAWLGENGTNNILKIYLFSAYISLLILCRRLLSKLFCWRQTSETSKHYAADTAKIRVSSRGNLIEKRKDECADLNNFVMKHNLLNYYLCRLQITRK